MSALRRRVLALDRQVRWLETEGALINIELRFKILEKKQEIADRLAADPATAAMWKAAGCVDDLPPPRVKPALPPRPPPAPPPPPEPAREQRVAAAPPPPPAPAPEPSLRPPEEPPPASPGYDPPEHMQIRPVRWRRRDAMDDLDDDDTPQDEDDDPLGIYE